MNGTQKSTTRGRKRKKKTKLNSPKRIPSHFQEDWNFSPKHWREESHNENISSRRKRKLKRVSGSLKSVILTRKKIQE